MTGLPEWITDPALVPTWKRIRTRFEKAGLETQGAVTVPLLTREERHAMGALLGRAVTRKSVRVDLKLLDTRLRERSGVGGLEAVLARYFGTAPMDRPALRAAQASARERPLALAAELVPQLWAPDWISGLRKSGLLTNRESPEQLVRDAAVVLNELTGPDRRATAQSRVELGARLFGDAHALDRDQLLHNVVIRGLAAASGTTPPEGARAREELWAEFGVEPDLLSRTCLVWRLEFGGSGSLQRRLSDAAESGDPVHLTEWDLRRLGESAPAPATRILVCENPRVVEALAEAEIAGWVAVCMAGEPNLVVDSVLDRLAQAGADLRYHGDFDWPGISIANRAIERYGLCPWLMGADEYLAAASGARLPLRGPFVNPSWDPELGAAMRSLDRAVHEESVLTELIGALERT